MKTTKTIPDVNRFGNLVRCLLFVVPGLLMFGEVQAYFGLRDVDNAWAKEFAESEYRTNKRSNLLDPADADIFDPVKFGVLIPGGEAVATNAAGQVVKRKVPTRYSLAPVTNLLAKVKSEKGVRLLLGKGEYCFGCLVSKVDIEDPGLPAGNVVVYVHLGGVVTWYPPEDVSTMFEDESAYQFLITYKRGQGGAAGPGWLRYGLFSYSEKEAGGRPYPDTPCPVGDRIGGTAGGVHLCNGP